MLFEAPPSVKNDLDVITIAVEQCVDTLGQAGDKIKDSYSLVLSAVSEDGHALQYTFGRLRNTPGIVMVAVRQNGVALQYAGDLASRKRCDFERPWESVLSRSWVTLILSVFL